VSSRPVCVCSGALGVNIRICRCGRVAFRARTPARSGPDPDQSPPLVLPASGRRAGVRHPVQLRQLIPVQPEPGCLPLRRQARRPRRPARHRRRSADPGDSNGSRRQASAVASFHGRPASRPATLGLPPVTGEAARTVTRNTARRGPGRGLGARNSQRCQCRLCAREVSSVLLPRPLARSVLMVRRRSTVRFRNGAPGDGKFSNGSNALRGPSPGDALQLPLQRKLPLHSERPGGRC